MPGQKVCPKYIPAAATRVLVVKLELKHKILPKKSIKLIETEMLKWIQE